MMKKFFNGEEGIALTVAAVVTVILFLIASAYFISTQSENTRALADKAGVKAIDVANAGAERALWDVQRRLDQTPTWQPEENEMPLFGNYDYFENLSEDKKDPDKYAKECIQVSSTVVGETSDSIGGVGSKVYAVKLMRGHEEVALGNNFWSIYSLGIDRSSSILGSKMEMRVTRVLIQLGANVGFPDTPFGTPGQVNTTRGQRVHIGGPSLSGLPVVQVGGWDDNEPLAKPNNPYFQPKIAPSTLRGWGDGWYRRNEFIMEQSQTCLPEIPINKIGIPGSGKDIIADYYIDLDNSGYENDERDLRHENNGWELINNDDNSQTLIPPYKGEYKGDLRRIGLFGREVDQNLLGTDGRALYDVNGDGYTVIYIPPGNINIRIYGLLIMPEVRGEVCRAIIASQGAASNLFDGVDAQGYLRLSTPPFYGSPGADLLMAADEQRNSCTGIDIRGIIKSYGFDSQNSFVDFIWDDVNSEMRLGNINYGEVRDDGRYKLDRTSGSLSLLADYDIIINATEAHQFGGSIDPQSRFRGLIYSKRDIILKEDLLLRGAMMAGGNIDLVDQSGLWYPQWVYGDGYDLAICHENAFNSSDGTRSLLPGVLAPAGGAGIMRILSWENINGRQIQKTF